MNNTKATTTRNAQNPNDGRVSKQVKPGTSDQTRVCDGGTLLGTSSSFASSPTRQSCRTVNGLISSLLLSEPRLRDNHGRMSVIKSSRR